MIKSTLFATAAVAAAIALWPARRGRAGDRRRPRRGQPEDADVRRMPRHRRLADRLPGGLQASRRSAASTRPTSSRRCRTTRAASAATRRCARSRRRCPTQDMADLAAYYAQAGLKTAGEMTMAKRILDDPRRRGRRSRQSAPAQAANLAAGQAKAKEVCAACHGADGNSQLPDYPKLAGQHSDYLAKALRDYKSGARKNPIMAGFAARAVEGRHRESRRVLARSRRRSRVRALSAGSDDSASRWATLRSIVTDRVRPHFAVDATLPLEAREVDRGIGRRAVPLRVPQHLAQAVEHARAARRARRRGRAAAARSARGCRGGWSMRQLLGDGQVQRQVQERIDVAAPRADSRGRDGARGPRAIAWYSGCSATMPRRHLLERRSAARRRGTCPRRRPGSGAPRRATA